MSQYFSYDELEGFQVFKSLDSARQNAGMLKDEEEDLAKKSIAGYRVLICYGTIEEIVLTNDDDLVLDLEGGKQDDN